MRAQPIVEHVTGVADQLGRAVCRLCRAGGRQRPSRLAIHVAEGR